MSRQAGVVLHPTSLPGGGTLGADAARFVQWCAEAGLGVWQVLPLGPPHGDRSPYQCQSVMAGDPALIDRREPLAPGWPLSERAASGSIGAQSWFAAARGAFESGASAELRESCGRFKVENALWLDDFAMFRAIRGRHAGSPWWEWPAPLADRDPRAVAMFGRENAGAIADETFAQFLFEYQWQRLRATARAAGVSMFGDAPIFVAEDSADVWANRDLFELDANGRPTSVAGVPPDYFSSTGQRWGNPLYRWEAMERDGFAWWLARLAMDLRRVDMLRLDHFRGLESYWAIPADEPTAVVGEWRPAPGAAFLKAVAERFGHVPIIAEDLGIITDEVTALRTRFDLPGMKVLQFAFGGDAANPYLPHNHEHSSVVYTGTHDNDTTPGWADASDGHVLAHACAYLGCQPEQLPDRMIDAAFASVGHLAMVPMQDFLGLGSDSRTNTPGVTQGNWLWHFDWAEVPADLAIKIRDKSQRYGRS